MGPGAVVGSKLTANERMTLNIGVTDVVTRAGFPPLA